MSLIAFILIGFFSAVALVIGCIAITAALFASIAFTRALWMIGEILVELRRHHNRTPRAEVVQSTIEQRYEAMVERQGWGN